MVFARWLSKGGDSLNPGATLAILTYVTCQFVEITFFTIAEAPITLQKVLAISLLPVAAVLMRKRLRLDRSLLLLAICVALAYSMWYLANRQFSGALATAGFSAVSGAVAAMLLYSALTDSPRSLHVLGWSWIGLSAASALVCLGQLVTGAVCSMVEHGSSFGWAVRSARATGFKADPNFEAMMLCIGLVFALVLVQRRRRVLIAVLILGIVSTVSRMGMLCAAMIVPLGLWMQERSSTQVKRKRPWIVMAVSLIVFTAVLQSFSGTSELADHFLAVRGGISAILRGEVDTLVGRTDLTSAQTRAIVITYAFRLALENWQVGLGAFRTPAALYQSTGLNMVAHNTALEFFLVGGVWGLGAVGMFVLVVFRGLHAVYREDDSRTWQILLVLISVAIFWCFSLLTVTYTSIVWLLPCLALAAKYWAGRAPMQRAEMSRDSRGE